MMILGVLFFVSVLQHLTLIYGTSTLPKLGKCTFKEYTKMMRSCTTKFFVDVRSDPNGTCRPKFIALKDCSVKILRPCVPSSLGENKTVIKDVIERNFKEKIYCDNAGIEFATVYPKVSPVPCAQAYYHQVPGCYNETLKLWQANKADPRICSEYTKAKLCDKGLIKAHCIVVQVYRQANELIELHYDNYNPFCMPLKIVNTLKTTLDPTATAPKTKDTKTAKKSKNTAWSRFHQGSFINSLLSYWAIIIISDKM